MENNEILALPMECWRWHPKFKGIAQVSTRGQVKTVDRWVNSKGGSKRFVKGRILRPVRDKDGYLRVCISRDGKPRTYKVHRLVAETWLDNPENKPQINHRDEDKTNCDVFNLSYCTAKENSNWGTRTKRQADKLSKSVQAIDPKTGLVVMEFPSAKEAGRKGFNYGHVADCCRGERRSYKSLVWRYKDDCDQENAWIPVKIGGEAVAARLSKPVQAIDPKTGLVVREFPSAREAGRKGFDSGAISACCRGKKSHITHKGYIWRYKP